MKNLWLILLSVCLVAPALRAQNSGNPGVPKVTASFVPDSIAIGDHFRLRIEIEKDLMQLVGFPEPDREKNLLTDYIEVLGESPVDTIKGENRRVTLVKEYLLTTFQAGVHSLKKVPVLYVDKNITDTLYSSPDSILLKVGTFEIDTLTQTIYDIKQPIKPKLLLGEISGYVLIELLVLVLVALGVYLYIRRKNLPGFLRSKRNDEPPHLAAIRALESLHHQKLWQNNKHKLYYTLLADIVRTYIDERYGVQAMEMTTDELLEALKNEESVGSQNTARLSSMLRLADLAKFAKYAPAPDDNEQCYNDAYYFIEDTKPMVEEPVKQPEE